MKQDRKVIGYSVIVALGGLLFGLDTAVISGAEQSIQALYKLSDFWQGFTVAIAIIGAVAGAFSAGFPSERFGRKKVIIAVSFIFTVTSVFSAFAPNWTVLLLCRFIGGLAIGASSVVGPMYIAEIAPAKIRGRLVGFFQFNVTAGLLVAYSSNYLCSGLGENAWRWMLGIVSLPSLIFFGLSLTIPESPRWLIRHNFIKEARRVLALLGRIDIETELNAIVESVSVV
jgi:MFS family permease